MDRQDYNKAEHAVNETKWTVNNYADRAKAADNLEPRGL